MTKDQQIIGRLRRFNERLDRGETITAHRVDGSTTFTKRKGKTMGLVPKRDDSLTLGDTVRDRITGYKGVAVCIGTWLNGCRRITIQSPTMKDGVPVASHTFDAEQVEVVTATPPRDTEPTGGPTIEPTRNADPV